MKLNRTIDYLEIGVREGDSLKVMADLPCVRIAVGIDTWGLDSGGTGRGSPWHIPPFIGASMEKVILLSASSHHILKGFVHGFDLIYVDGKHDEPDAKEDLEDCIKLLKPNGIMIADDADHPKHPYLRGVFVEFAQTHNLDLTFHYCGYGVAEMRFK
jgi:hypothetical protein